MSDADSRQRASAEAGGIVVALILMLRGFRRPAAADLTDEEAEDLEAALDVASDAAERFAQLRRRLSE